MRVIVYAGAVAIHTALAAVVAVAPALAQDAPVALPSLPPIVAQPQTGLGNRQMPPAWPTDGLRQAAQKWFAREGCTQPATQLPSMARALELIHSEALFLLRTLEEEGTVEISHDRKKARYLDCP